MPIYEYTCRDCGAHFDVLRPMKDADAPVQCQQCLGTNARRNLSTFFASSGERALAGGSGQSCSGCSGGSCSHCGH